MLSLSVTGLITDLIKAFMETFNVRHLDIHFHCTRTAAWPVHLYYPGGSVLAEPDSPFNRRTACKYCSFDAFCNLARSLIPVTICLPEQRSVRSPHRFRFRSLPSLLCAACRGSLVEVDKGVLEAATAMGATNGRIIREVLLVEALPGLLRGLTVTVVSLVGYTAMAGIVGGGGVGDLAIRFGYYRYETNVMIITVVLLIVLVQVIQSLGELIAGETDKR